MMMMMMMKMMMMMMGDGYYHDDVNAPLPLMMMMMTMMVMMMMMGDGYDHDDVNASPSPPQGSSLPNIDPTVRQVPPLLVQTKPNNATPPCFLPQMTEFFKN